MVLERVTSVFPTQTLQIISERITHRLHNCSHFSSAICTVIYLNIHDTVTNILEASLVRQIWESRPDPLHDEIKTHSVGLKGEKHDF